jgi:hypothetical protein
LEYSFCGISTLHFLSEPFLGINVENKFVSIDQSHQDLVDTSDTNNPTKGLIGELFVHYVFRRKKTNTHNGDGNPLVYALKGIKGYKIKPSDLEILYGLADEILSRLVDDLEVDAVLDVPSSKPLCRLFASRVSGVLGVPLIESSFLRKRTVGEVLNFVDAKFPEITKGSDRKAFKSVLGVLRNSDRENIFQMKDVSRSVRKFFRPFVAIPTTPNLAGRRILLVDDLVSSGTSIMSVAECLRELGASVENGICLLSDLS